jgi:hypothetical protein
MYTYHGSILSSTLLCSSCLSMVQHKLHLLYIPIKVYRGESFSVSENISSSFSPRNRNRPSVISVVKKDVVFRLAKIKVKLINST